MSVDHNALRVLDSRVVLEGSAIHANLLAHFCDCVLVVVSAHVQLEDAFSDVGVRLQVDLEQLCLKVAFVSKVALQSFEKEGSSLLDLVEFQEHSDDAFEWGLGLARAISHRDHLSELQRCLRVDRNHGSKDLHEIGLVVGLLAVRNNLVELLGFNETHNDLVGRTGSLVYFKCHLGVVLTDYIAEGIRHGELVLGDPVLNNSNLALLQNRRDESK